MVQMLRNNPPDVAVDAYAEAFPSSHPHVPAGSGDADHFVTDRAARDMATRHFFKRAWRAVHARRPGA